MTNQVTRIKEAEGPVPPLPANVIEDDGKQLEANREQIDTAIKVAQTQGHEDKSSDDED